LFSRKQALVINNAVIIVIATSIRAISAAVSAIREKKLACNVKPIAYELTSWTTRRSSCKIGKKELGY
jgi:hypothetical protein